MNTSALYLLHTWTFWHSGAGWVFFCLDDDFPLFKHIDSFDLYPSWFCSFQAHWLFWSLSQSLSFQNKCFWWWWPIGKYTDSLSIQRVPSVTLTDTDKEIPPRVFDFDPRAVGTLIIFESVWGSESGNVSQQDQFGCQFQEAGGQWRFTYQHQQVLVITDSNVQVRITMYEHCGTICKTVYSKCTSGVLAGEKKRTIFFGEGD
jgi:hypothetical protein